MEIEYKGVRCRIDDMRQAVALINLITTKRQIEEKGEVTKKPIVGIIPTVVRKRCSWKHKTDAQLLEVLRGIKRKMSLQGIARRAGYRWSGKQLSGRILRLIADNNLKYILKRRKNRFAKIE